MEKKYRLYVWVCQKSFISKLSFCIQRTEIIHLFEYEYESLLQFWMKGMQKEGENGRILHRPYHYVQGHR